MAENGEKGARAALNAYEKLVRDQGEANTEMVKATIRAHEATDAAEAAQARAEESERELRSVAEFREMFIGVVSHDLRNPLSAITMAAGQLLKRGRLDEYDATAVARIVNAGQRMTRMITQLLDLTHARLGGGMPIEPRPTDLRDVCESVVEEFGGSMQLDVEGDVTGSWDADRLAEALSNIAGNAVRHAAPRTMVAIKAHGEEAAVVVEIINQGDPIPPAVLPFIFEPFRRAKQRGKSATENLGLGLYIAHQVAVAHGGTLDAHSAGGSTTFAMRLPRRPPSGAARSTGGL